MEYLRFCSLLVFQKLTYWNLFQGVIKVFTDYSKVYSAFRNDTDFMKFFNDYSLTPEL